MSLFTTIETRLTEKEDQKAKADRIHRSIITLDSHTDTPLQLGRRGFDITKRNDPYNRGGKIDFPRMQEGSLDAVFFAVFIGQGDRNTEAYQKAGDRADQIFALVKETLSVNSNIASLALTADDVYKIKKQGKKAIYLGLENGYPLGLDPAMTEKYYKLGARYITLAHTRNNDICDSSTDPAGPEHNGLSEFGKQVVKEMNRLGMMIDVSHISDNSFYDVLKSSKAPVIASHSNARTLCSNPRNLTDEMLRALKKNGGVVQLCLLSAYVKNLPANPERVAAREVWNAKYGTFDQVPEEKRETAREEWQAINAKFPEKLAAVSDLADHLDHIVKMIGIDHVGIGSDFDGGGGLEDCFDVSQIGNITLELVRRGYNKKEIEKIWGGNFLRVFREVEKLAIN